MNVVSYEKEAERASAELLEWWVEERKERIYKEY
jgi:hypothetical protein